MKYLVMECGTAYAVVLDDRGKFLRVANMGYEVGQTVTDVIPAGNPSSQNIRTARRLARLAASAVLTFLMMFGAYYYIFASFGTVRMQINPDILISVNRLGYALNVSGLNEDGRLLAEGYGTLGKKLSIVSNDMAERAMALGYLKHGGNIGITADSDDHEWSENTETRLMIELQVHLAEYDLEVNVMRGQDYPVDIKDDTEADPVPMETVPVESETKLVETQKPVGTQKPETQKTGTLPSVVTRPMDDYRYDDDDDDDDDNDDNDDNDWNDDDDD